MITMAKIEQGAINATSCEWLTTALKRLASAVQLRPWPPSFKRA